MFLLKLICCSILFYSPTALASGLQGGLWPTFVCVVKPYNAKGVIPMTIPFVFKF